MEIRKAKIQDADKVIPLLLEALGSTAPAFCGTEIPEEIEDIYRQYFCEEEGRFSYHQFFVVLKSGEICGMIAGHETNQLDQLNQRVYEELQKRGKGDFELIKESMDGDYYIEVLTVAEAYRSQGIGKKIIAFFENEARRRKCSQISLVVLEENEEARKLYEKLGYKVQNAHSFYFEDFYYMARKSE